MRATLQRVNGVEKTVTKHVRFGKFVVKNVPHIELEHPTPYGEKYIRDAIVDIRLARAQKFMKEHAVYSIEFADDRF